MEKKEIFEYFDDIYENREQYNMSWAFKDAQEKLDSYKKDVVDNRMKKKCSGCKTLNKNYEKYKEKSHSQIKKQKIISRIFSNMHDLVNVLEIILSVILVLVISEISHGEFAVHGTRAFSAAVVIVFAFIKVFIEQIILKPRMEALGWRLYKNSIGVLRGLSEQINDEISDREVLAEAV